MLLKRIRFIFLSEANNNSNNNKNEIFRLSATGETPRKQQYREEKLSNVDGDGNFNATEQLQ